MKFIKLINHKKFALVSIFLFFYIVLNLLDGERGLISYNDKLKIKKQLIKEKELPTILKVFCSRPILQQ